MSKYTRILNFDYTFLCRCPSNTKVITPFKYDPKSGYADAALSSMFRFPDSPELYFQCDIEVCRGACAEPDCDSSSALQLQLLQQQQVSTSSLIK